MKRTFKESTWNYIIVALLALLALYLAVPSALADETDVDTEEMIGELEFMASACAATYAIIGVELENEGYVDEGRRWFHWLVGFTNNNEGRTREMIKERATEAYTRLGNGNSSLDDFRQIADVECIRIRDGVIALVGGTIDDWYDEGE